MLNIHTDIKSKLNTFIEQKKIPNLILHGVAGSGKKTLLFNFLKEVYSNNKTYLQDYVMTKLCTWKRDQIHSRRFKIFRKDKHRPT